MAKTLGKGLEALIQSYGGEKKEKYLHGNLPIKNIIPNKNQPRQYFNTKEIEEGYYDREDFTDWVKSDFGIKNLKSVKEILENL